MRSFGAVSPKFWAGNTGRSLRGYREGQVVALYLMTAPSSHQTGIYYLPVAYIANDTGIPIQGASKALRRLIEGQFCRYDPTNEWVWVCEMAQWQIGEPTSPDDKRIIGVQRYVAELPNLAFLPDFFARYASAFRLMTPAARPKEPSPSEGARKPLRSQDQDQDQDQELKPIVPSELVKPTLDDPVLRVFAHWQTVHDHPQARLDGKRRKAIRQALTTYPEDCLRACIDGYKRSPHHQGKNGSGTVYDSIELMLRDAAHIDAGIKLANSGGAERWI